MLTVISKPAILYIVDQRIHFNFNHIHIMPKATITYTIEEAANLLQEHIRHDIPADVVEVFIDGHTNMTMPFPPIDDVPAYVLHGIMIGNLIQAIKDMRADSRNRGSDGNTLMGLKECKDYVEKIRDQYFSPYVDRITNLGR